MSEAEKGLKHEFVGMMFAVTVGEIGIKAADVIRFGNFSDHIPAYTHLVLSLVLVALSWVGWTKSRSPGAQSDVIGIFDKAFLILLVDVLLVICYFILVRFSDFVQEGAAPKYEPSAAPECQWICVIFGIYILWDLLTKSKKGMDKDAMIRAIYRTLVTVICFSISFLIMRMYSNVQVSNIPAVDFALISLLFLFRAGKSLVSFRMPEVQTIQPHWDRGYLKWSIALILIIVGLLAQTKEMQF